MTKAFEVMTRFLATCAPEAPVSEVASTMRDRDIGTVLVVKDGELRGIITDRDLAVRAVAENDSFGKEPISRYMTEQVHTGHADWSLEHVSDYMAKHQIRRLPIVEEGQLTGIVSLGDVARNGVKKQKVADSLREISEPTTAGKILARAGAGRMLASVLLAASAAATFAILSANHAVPFRRKKPAVRELYDTAQRFRRTKPPVKALYEKAQQLRHMKPPAKVLYEKAQQRLSGARKQLSKNGSPEPVREMRKVGERLGARLGSKLDDLFAQLSM